ncbi:Holliday junction resolvase [Candidatus Woesearchaeota archaeon]|nr:Holliday junction resolvase [Candidatus Woesearchaeota archaeon]
MSKTKGSRTERELLHLFWKTGKFVAMRAAGSASIPLPCPDLLVGGKGRVLAIECKGGKSSRYIDKQQISELKEFAEKFGAEPWVGARFNNTEWLFLKIKDLKESKTGNNFVIDVKFAKERGIKFEELIAL